MVTIQTLFDLCGYIALSVLCLMSDVYGLESTLGQVEGRNEYRGSWVSDLEVELPAPSRPSGSQ